MVWLETVEVYFPAFKAQLEAQGTPLPRHVEQEYEVFLKCGRLEYGFLRVRCESCSKKQIAWAAPEEARTLDWRRPRRYISRPAIAEKRLSLTPNGNVRYRLKTPYRDGTTRPRSDT